MKKKTLIQDTLTEANSVLNLLQQGTIPEYNSINVWTEALCKYVLFSAHDHPIGVYFQNASRSIVTQNIPNAIITIQGVIEALEDLHIHHPNRKIEYENTFDATLQHPETDE